MNESAALRRQSSLYIDCDRRPLILALDTASRKEEQFSDFTCRESTDTDWTNFEDFILLRCHTVTNQMMKLAMACMRIIMTGGLHIDT